MKMKNTVIFWTLIQYHSIVKIKTMTKNSSVCYMYRFNLNYQDPDAETQPINRDKQAVGDQPTENRIQTNLHPELFYFFHKTS